MAGWRCRPRSWILTDGMPAQELRPSYLGSLCARVNETWNLESREGASSIPGLLLETQRNAELRRT